MVGAGFAFAAGVGVAVGVAVESSVAVASVVVESSVADVESEVVCEDVEALAALPMAVEFPECVWTGAPDANPPIRTVAPTAADPVATVSFLMRRRLRSRFCADGSRGVMTAFEQSYLNVR